jgi:hypothetical protein
MNQSALKSHSLSNIAVSKPNTFGEPKGDRESCRHIPK